MGYYRGIAAGNIVVNESSEQLAKDAQDIYNTLKKYGEDVAVTKDEKLNDILRDIWKAVDSKDMAHKQDFSKISDMILEGKFLGLAQEVDMYAAKFLARGDYAGDAGYQNFLKLFFDDVVPSRTSRQNLEAKVTGEIEGRETLTKGERRLLSDTYGVED